MKKNKGIIIALIIVGVLAIGIILLVLLITLSLVGVFAVKNHNAKEMNNQTIYYETSDNTYQESVKPSGIVENLFTVAGENENESDFTQIFNTGDYKVGLSFPTESLNRWKQDGYQLKNELEQEGYIVDLRFADNNIEDQKLQIEDMIIKDCDILVIASIDGDSLGTILEQAKNKNIPVIAYDRLIRNTDAVTYYVTFDNYMVGTKQGQYIEDQLGLKEGKGPYNLEIFTGDPGDNSARFFYKGAMDVLNPYIDNGQLVVPSGQIDFDTVATVNWSSDVAQTRMEHIISTYYLNGTKLDAILCSNDSTAFGVTNAIEAKYNDAFPIITGQDCERENVKNIIKGKQSMSIFKDTQMMVSRASIMVDEILRGQNTSVNDTSTFNNGYKVVPSYLCEPTVVDKANYYEILIDSGYYQENEF